MAHTSLTFRALGSRGEAYPAWLTSLGDVSGVYVLRLRESGEVVYVGESHSGNLVRTLTRHLQAWGRSKTFWRGFAPNDPGTTYVRAKLDAAVLVMPATRVLRRERELIHELKPRDNVVGQLGLAMGGKSRKRRRAPPSRYRIPSVAILRTSPGGLPSLDFDIGEIWD